MFVYEMENEEHKKQVLEDFSWISSLLDERVDTIVFKFLFEGEEIVFMPGEYEIEGELHKFTFAFIGEDGSVQKFEQKPKNPEIVRINEKINYIAVKWQNNNTRRSDIYVYIMY